MRHKFLTVGLIFSISIILLSSTPVFCNSNNQHVIITAQENQQSNSESVEKTTENSPESLNVRGNLLIVSAFSAALAIGIAAFGAALAQGNALARALESIGRNPESQSKIFPTLVLGLAFIESLALYALLISLALVFFNPLITKL